MGYGIKDDLHNDYANIKVKGKIVVAIKGEPKNKKGDFKVYKYK